MTRLQVRSGRSNPLMRGRLRAIAFRSEPASRDWAHRTLALAGPFQGGFYDLWVGRWSPTGSLLWQAQYGTSGSEVGYEIAVNPLVDGFFVAGYCFEGTFGGAPLGGTDAMVAKVDENGALVWAKRFGTASDEVLNSMAPDLVDGCFVFGRCSSIPPGRIS